MVLKIAILTERFATEVRDSNLGQKFQLLIVCVTLPVRMVRRHHPSTSMAGDHVGPEVWYRIVQLVTNNEDLQQYAAKAVYGHLRASTCRESYQGRRLYLGEFGHLIANDEGCSPIEQFHALHGKINLCSAPTRALLLTTYIKVG